MNRIHDAAVESALKQYAHGILLDIGCGEKPYESMTQGLVTIHIGLDHPGSLHNKQNTDIFATAYETGVAAKSIDTVLCTVVLEHLEYPQEALNEIYRIMKPGGYLIISTPLFWHLHEEPRDFFRYTKYGLAHLLSSAGFELIELNPLSGFTVTFCQELVYFLNRLRRGPFRYPTTVIQTIIQMLAFKINRWDRSYRFTWAYLAVARKRLS